MAVYWTNRALCFRKREWVRPFSSSALLVWTCYCWLKWIFCFFFLLLGVCSDWTKVEEDCRKALELDSSSVKVSIALLCFSILLEVIWIGFLFFSAMELKGFMLDGFIWFLSRFSFPFLQLGSMFLQFFSVCLLVQNLMFCFSVWIAKIWTGVFLELILRGCFFFFFPLTIWWMWKWGFTVCYSL